MKRPGMAETLRTNNAKPVRAIAVSVCGRAGKGQPG